MKVFIENPAGSLIKNIYDERTLEFRKSVSYARATPYHYGLIVNTVSGDGDNLDCFVLSPGSFPPGTIIEVNPIGMVEYRDSGKTDDKVLCVLKGEKFTMDQEVRDKITDFLIHVFDNKPG